MALARARFLPPGLRVGVCICVWWTCAVVVTLMLKSILGKASGTGHTEALFPYPFAFTALTNGGMATIAGLGELARWAGARCGCGPGQEKGSFYDPCFLNDAIQLGAVGLLQGIEIGCFNKALEFLTVAKRTMIMSTSLLFQLGAAVPLGLEQMSLGKAIAALLLTCGGSLQGLSTWRHRSSLHDDGKSFYGYGAAVLGMVLASCRWALLQHVFQRARPESYLRQMSKLQMLLCIMPITATVCCVLAAAFEGESFAHIDLHVLHGALVVSLILACMVTSEFVVVQLTSAVAMNVAAQLHNIPIMLGGVAFFHESIHPFAAVGFSLCLTGALLYACERRSRDAKETVTAPDIDLEDDDMADEEMLIFLANCRKGGETEPEFARVRQDAVAADDTAARILCRPAQAVDRDGFDVRPVAYGASGTVDAAL